MRLRHRILLAYALVFGLWAVGLGLYTRAVVGAHVTALERDALLSEARMARSDLLPKAGAAASAAGQAAEAGGAASKSAAASLLQARALKIGQTLDARVTVIDPNGTVLADSEHDPATMENYGLRPEVVQARREGWGWAVRRSPILGLDMLYVALAAKDRATVVRLAEPLSEVSRLNADLFNALLIALLVAAVVGAAASVRISGGLARSLTHLARVAAAIGGGDLSARAAIRSHDEAGDLADAINGMAESLQREGAELADRTAQVQAILRHMADGLILVGADGRVELVNPTAARLLDVKPREALGRPLVYVVTNYDLAEATRRTMEMGTVTEVEFPLVEGEETLLHAAVAPLSGRGGGREAAKGAVVVLRDVTNVRRLERVRQDFVANAGHELRTPVAAIRSLAEALGAGAMHDPEAGPAFLDQIVQNTERLGRLLDDMMELARLEAVGEPVEPVDVGAVVTSAVERLRPQADLAAMTLDADVPAGLSVLGNADGLETALVNLIDNAVKYAAEGRAVQVRCEREDGRVHISVIDHGPGVPANDRRRVFERFYRVDRARSRELGGTGLGLSIVKHAIENMGGKVALRPTPGGGTTVVLSLNAVGE